MTNSGAGNAATTAAGHDIMGPSQCKRSLSSSPRAKAGLFIVLAGFCCAAQAASEPEQTPAWKAARALMLDAYNAAAKEYSANAKSAEISLKFGRACFELAEFPESKKERAKVAEEGIAACRKSVELQSNSAAAHYYWAMNLGQVARTKGFSALSTIGPMKRQFEIARELDPKFDNAGPDRNLGYLYRDAPVWAGIGDRKKARLHLTRAVELCPDYPENRLALIEAYLRWGERDKAKEQLKELDRIWPSTKERMVGPVLEVTLEDWEGQLKKARDQLR